MGLVYEPLAAYQAVANTTIQNPDLVTFTVEDLPSGATWVRCLVYVLPIAQLATRVHFGHQSKSGVIEDSVYNYSTFNEYNYHSDHVVTKLDSSDRIGCYCPAGQCTVYIKVTGYYEPA